MKPMDKLDKMLRQRLHGERWARKLSDEDMDYLAAALLLAGATHHENDVDITNGKFRLLFWSLEFDVFVIEQVGCRKLLGLPPLGAHYD